MADYQGKRFKTSNDGAARASTGAHAAHRAQQGGTRFRTGSSASTASQGAAHARPASTTTGSTASRAGAARGVQPARTAQGVQPVRRSSSRSSTSSAHGRRAGGGSVPPSHGGVQPSSYSSEPPRRRKRRILPIALITVGAILLLVAGGILISTLLGYQQAVSTYDELASLAQIEDSDGSGIPRVDFDALSEINPDIVAWIYVPGTNINYPVVQGDDNETYLTTLFNGSPNASGSIFLDMDSTAPGLVDQQTTVYGHHMNNRTMFYEIDETRDQSAFDEITVVYYITPETTYVCTPLMTSVVPEDYLSARQANFTGDETLASYLADLYTYVSAEADDVDERIETADRVLTLITCNWSLTAGDRTIMCLTVDEELETLAPDDSTDDATTEDAA